MENPIKRIEGMILESADRARLEGNQAWELEALRIHAGLRRLGDIGVSERFRLLHDQNGCVVKIDGKEVALDGRRASFMSLLAEKPNQLVPQRMVNKAVFDGKVGYDAIQTVWEQLRSQVGEHYFVRAHRRGFIFLHPDTLLPED